MRGLTDEVCPTLVRGADRTAETFPIVRAEHRMHMIGHEASGPHFDFRFAPLPGKHVATDVLVAVLEEDRRAPVAPRGDMVRAAGDGKAQQTGHALLLHASPRILRACVANDRQDCNKRCRRGASRQMEKILLPDHPAWRAGDRWSCHLFYIDGVDENVRVEREALSAHAALRASSEHPGTCRALRARI